MGGQSFQCGCCKRWFTLKYNLWNHVKDTHRQNGKPCYEDPRERKEYDRGFARGWWGDAQEKNRQYPNAYGRGYWEGVYVADPHGATK